MDRGHPIWSKHMKGYGNYNATNLGFLLSQWNLGICYFLTWVIPTAGDQIIFSEIKHASGSSEIPTWIELTNLTSTPLDCANWELKGRSIRYTFPAFDPTMPRTSFIRPFERCIITETTPEKLRASQPIPPSVRIWGPWEGRLREQGERLILRDKNDVELCRVDMKSNQPWPVDDTGKAYTRVIRNPDRHINDWRNWSIGHHPNGTPGMPSPAEEGSWFEVRPKEPFWIQHGNTPVHTSWHFYAGTSKASKEWMQPDFDDSSWPRGLTPFVLQGDPGPLPNIHTRLDPDLGGYRFRHTFHLERSDIMDAFYLKPMHHAGASYYLNGILIFPSHPPESSSAGMLEEKTLESKSDTHHDGSMLRVKRNTLKPGSNTLSVSVRWIEKETPNRFLGAGLWHVPHKNKPELQFMELGIDFGGQGYTLLKNVSKLSLALGDYQIIASTPNKGHAAVHTPLPMETLPAMATKRIHFTGSLLSHSHLSLLKTIIPQTGYDLPIRVPGHGFRQTLEDSSRDLWKISSVQKRSPPEAVAASKGNIHINEIAMSSDGKLLTIELHNSFFPEIPLDGLGLSFNADLSSPIELKGTLTENTFVTLQRKTPQNMEKDHPCFLFEIASRKVLDTASLTLQPATSTQRFPDGTGTWFVSSAHSLGEPNSSPAHQDIILNEIMYDPPFGLPDLEFVELYNRGDTAIQMSNWALTGGVSFIFPKGLVMAPKNYLVVADHPEVLHELHPQMHCVGPLKGKLSNSGERIQLLDSHGNLADEIDYRTEGDWPFLARGRGSSMELIHPDMDNAYSSAWKDSHVSRISPFKAYKFQMHYKERMNLWHPMDRHELHLYLVGESHIVLQNIQVRRRGTSQNLLNHPERMSLEGDSSTGWLIQGNHADSYVENGRIHLIAHGHGDNRANRAEIDIQQLEEGENYEIQFEARWVHGSPRLIVRSWENSLSESILLPIPKQLGSPGRENTRLQPDPPPLVESLHHIPSVPAPDEPLKIKTLIGWGKNKGIVQLVYRKDDPVGTKWKRIPMRESPGPHVSTNQLRSYEVTLHEGFEQGDILQYYVEAFCEKGPRTTLPRQAAARPALCVFDGRTVPKDLRVVRLVISSKDLDAMYQGEKAAHGFRYPRLSNQYFNATFISNERDIYHGAELRSSGSPWTRRNSLQRGKWRLPEDRRFRNHGKFSFDDDPTRRNGTFRYHNRIARYLLYLLGHVSGQNEFIYLIVNAADIQVREDVEPVDADYLNRNFKDGNQGDLYRVDDDWWMSDHWSQHNEDASWKYLGTSDSGPYRHAWMKRSSEEEDDYRPLIDFFSIISQDSYTQAEVDRILDSEAILKMTAVMGYIANWDTFTQSRGKNAYFYQRPADKQFQFLQWDADLSFQNHRYNRFYGGSGQFIRWLEQAYHYPLFLDYLDQLASLTKDSDGRMEAWMREESQGIPQTRPNIPFYRQFFDMRNQDISRLKKPSKVSIPSP
jgi:hypothetical protein